MKLTVGHKVSALAVTAALLTTTLVAVVNSAFRQASARQTDVIKITSALHHHGEADMMHDALRADVLEALLGARRNDAALVTEAQKGVVEHEGVFRSSLAANQQTNLGEGIAAVQAQLAGPLELYIASASKLVQLAAKDSAAAEVALPDFLKAFGELEIKMGAVGDSIEEEAHRINAESAAANAGFSRALWYGAGASLFILGVLAVIVTRSIPRPFLGIIQRLEEAVRLNTESSNQVSGTSNALASGASQQAAALEESSAALEEISSMAKRNAASAQQATEAFRRTREGLDLGLKDTAAMNAAVDAISVSSNGIAKILKTIDEIAFQTNILALNAAVEAARAGDAGNGFAVVAGEVRELAQRSARAAKETAEKIDDSLVRSRHGVEVCRKVAAGFDHISKSTREVETLVGEIAQASQEQTQGIDQVNHAVAEMDKVIQGSAAQAEEGAAVAQELSRQSLDLQSAVNALAIALGGSRVKTVKPQRSRGAGSKSHAPVADALTVLPAAFEG